MADENPEANEWQCGTCDERHQANFVVCWKCGRDQSGNLDPEFAVYDSANINSESHGPGDGDPVLTLCLPEFSYFALPIFLILGSSAIWFASPQELPLNDWVTVPSGDSAPSSRSEAIVKTFYFVANVAFFILVLVPVFMQGVKLVRWLFSGSSGKNYFETTAMAIQASLKMFLLPASMGQRHPWFVVIYYASFVIFLSASLSKFYEMAVEIAVAASDDSRFGDHQNYAYNSCNLPAGMLD